MHKDDMLRKLCTEKMELKAEVRNLKRQIVSLESQLSDAGFQHDADRQQLERDAKPTWR